jgi:uncharacterized protein YodC (DUF2158 family)
MSPRFTVGDVVRLKSGGPNMTVGGHGKYNYDPQEKYLCRWFDEKNKLTGSLFRGRIGACGALVITTCFPSIRHTLA